MKTFIYGIDFGTTNSALAIFDTENGEVVQLFTAPSLLFFPEAKILRSPISYSVGEAAVQNYVDSGMNGRFMKSIKKILPNKSFIDTDISNKSFRAEDLVALILSHLKKQADDFLQEVVTTAVVGRPVVFDEDPKKDKLAQDRLLKAAKIAGFDKVFFQFEPIGAAFTYERQIEKPEIVLVADFGGGTSDFSVMRLNPASIHNPDRSGDMMAKGGIYIGGDNIDSDIMWHRGTPHFGRGVKEEYEKGRWLDLPLAYFHNICSWEKMNLINNNKWRESISKSYTYSGKNPRVKNLQTLVEKNLGYLLFKQIEQCKFGLTRQNVSDFRFDAHDIHIQEAITLDDFENVIIKKNMDKIEDYLLNFLSNQNLTIEQIDSVFMTGGTAYVRALQKMFARVFGQEKLKSGDNFNSVALGIAYSYPVLNNS